MIEAMNANRRQHWDDVYGRKTDTEVSWYEAESSTSLKLFDAVGITPEHSVVDVGAGVSRLTDALLGRGFTDLTALDISSIALAASRRRLGDSAGSVQWVVADLLSWRPDRRWAAWHDRAVLHFLTEPADQLRYRDLMSTALLPGAVAVIGVFAEDGPEQCSGLPIARHTHADIAATLGSGFEVVEQIRAEHQTPWGAIQPFNWLAARRRQ